MLAMEQLTLFPEPQVLGYAVRVSCDQKALDLPEGTPEVFESEVDARMAVESIRVLLEDSGYAIQFDARPYGWVGLQKLSDGVHVWRGEVMPAKYIY